MNPAPELTPRSYYRLPWSLTDNGISWIEVTDACNLACEGCYRPHKVSHKSLQQISDDLDVFKRERKSDCMSIAGGDPLMHPQIVEIVKIINDRGWKAILNTNGLAMTPELLKQLKKAGVAGFTFHIDTTQVRKDSRATKEGEHNALRMKFAEMVAAEGGMACSFNQTVSWDTLDQVKETFTWARKHPNIVNTIVYILFRSPRLTGDFDFYANGKKISMTEAYENSKWGGDKLLYAKDIVAKLKEVDPNFEPSAYLSGTVDPNSTKWLLAGRIASTKRCYGYVGANFMKSVQVGSQMLRGKYLSYSPPSLLSAGRTSTALFSLVDPKMRKIAKKYLWNLVKRPHEVLEKTHLQTFTVIQPLDMMPDGRMNMCDACPDMTVHNGKMYWSCRLEEIKEHGCFFNAVPRKSCGVNVDPCMKQDPVTTPDEQHVQ